MCAKASSQDTLFLIDSMSIVFQSFYAIRNLTNREGVPTNAIFGFARKLQKLIADYDPSHIVATFESTKPTFRKEMYEEYKANREAPPEELKAQIPYIFRLLDAMHVPHIYRDGYEADDLIGTLSKRATESGMQTLIVSADKDLFQLIDDHVKMLRSAKSDLELFDAKAVEEKMGVPPEKMIDYLAMVGDSSDNIPGIAGIGPKTAVNYLEQFGSLENLLENYDQLKTKKQRERIEENRENALLSKKLATIACDIDVEWDPENFTCDPVYYSDELIDLYKELGFSSLIKEARQAQEAEEGGSASLNQASDATGKTASDSKATQDAAQATEWAIVSKAEDLEKLVGNILEAGVVAFDTETTSVDSMQARLVGISLSYAAGTGYYIPIGHCQEQDLCLQIPLDDVREILSPIFSDPTIYRIAHNAKYDLRILRRHDFRVSPVHFDTMLAAYLLDPDGRCGLKHLSLMHFGVVMTEIVELLGKGRSSITMDQVTIEAAAPYACADADMTFRLYELFREQLEKNDLLDLFKNIEMPLVEVLDNMESEGVTLDLETLEEIGSAFRKKIDRLSREIFKHSGRAFNIKSPQQVADILFKDIGLQSKRKTKTGLSTSSEVLEELSKSHPLPGLILEFRRLDKLLSTYVDALPQMVNPETGRVHTSYNQFIAATGRLSSSEPNLQNIPIRTTEGRMIRRAFIPNGADHVFLAADYSQIELRVLAHLCGDPALQEAFRENIDIHSQTAVKVFGMPAEMVTDDMRSQAKVINFGILYGMGPHRLSRELDISFKQAREFIEDYFQAYPGVRRWIDETLEKARQRGYVETMSGRRRLTPNLNADNHNVRSNAERVATNTPIQGASADMIKIAMIRLHEELARGKWQAKMVLQVHDELVFSLPQEELEDFKPLVREYMEKAMQLDVPIKVDMESGRNWAEC